MKISFGRMVREGLSVLKDEEPALGTAFEEKGTASAKALRLDCA